jgi:hypothetical protein
VNKLGKMRSKNDRNLQKSTQNGQNSRRKLRRLKWST